ncbi:MAG: 2-oxoacid:acceptor oxidoreductase family protein [Desulfurococcaceae archaeon]
MRLEVLIVGRGGQGVLLLGKLIGVAASKYQPLYAAVMESYASETRGGMSRADVVIADRPEEVLGFAGAERPDIAFILYPYDAGPLANMGEGSHAFADSYYVRELRCGACNAHLVDYTTIATQGVGSPRFANVVALGHAIGVTGFLDVEAARKAIAEVVPGRYVEANVRALELGRSIARSA